MSEALYVYRGGSGDDARERESVDLAPLQRANLLQVLAVDTDAEAATFVALTVELDDGEAEALALAIHRNLAVATDDRKTLRIINQRFPDVEVFTTPSLLKQWADHCAIDPTRLRYVLRDVQERGNYLPRNDDALRAWWQRAVSDA